MDEVSWLTSQVYSVMMSFCLTRLSVEPACELKSSPPPASIRAKSLVKLHELWIAASLSINTLVDLLSNIDLDLLGFDGHCQVMDMSSYSPPSPQVSQSLAVY